MYKGQSRTRVGSRVRCPAGWSVDGRIPVNRCGSSGNASPEDVPVTERPIFQNVPFVSLFFATSGLAPAAPVPLDPDLPEP